MAVNRFDKAAEAAFINTYTPIDFGALYQIGAANNAAVEKALKELGSQIKEWAQFSSPSAVDTAKWYDLTLNKGKELIQRLAENPDLIKTAAGRAEIQGFINSTDYATLNGLKQSKEQMIARLKYNQELAIKGLFDPILHTVDFTNYDTSKHGIFQDVSPLPYKSVVDMVKPYVDNLDDRFLGDSGGWIRHGVTAADTDKQVNENWSSIITDPHYTQNLQKLMKLGLSEEDATKRLDAEIYLAGREFTRDKVTRDPWWIKQREREWEAADNAANNGDLKNLTEILEGDASRLLLENFTSLTPAEMQLFDKYDNATAMKMLTPEKQQEVRNATNKNYISGQLKHGFIEIAEKDGIKKAVNWVINTMSTPISEQTAKIYAGQGTTGKLTKDGYYLANDSRNFELMDEWARHLITQEGPVGDGFGAFSYNISFDKGNNILTQSRQKFLDDWYSGDKFHNFLIVTDTRKSTDGSKIKIHKYAYVPVEQFSDYTPEEMQQVNGTRVTLGEDNVTVSQRDSDAGISTTTTTVGEKEKEYIRIPVATTIPRTGEAAHTANVLYNKLQGISSKTIDALTAKSNVQVTN